MQAKTEPLLRFRGVMKQLGGTQALAGVDMDVRGGEIHALLGANGAGKSTLIKSLAGVHQLDSGEILFKGQPVHHRDIEKLPIAFIHQDLGLFDWMTVAENIAVVRGYSRKGGLIDWKRVEAEATRALEIVGSNLHPKTLLSELSRAEKSIVAIARALAANVACLVLDEPTSSLPEADVAHLFEVLFRLRDRGVGIIYVSHRLDEIFRIADRVTVLRDGRNVGSSPIAEMTPAELVLLIVGQPPADVFLSPPTPTAQVVLEVREMVVGDTGPVSLCIRSGEILGICGLLGAGQNVVGRAITGIVPLESGTVVLNSKGVHVRSPGDAIKQGIAFVSSSRQEESLGMTLSVQENLFLNPAIRGRKFSQPLSRREEARQADALVREFLIRPSDPARVVSTLSGGNQQKVVLARWLDVHNKVLVMEEPTLGVDIGAKAEIYALLNRALQQGLAVLLISSDLEEVVGICHRALIINRGHIVGEVQREAMSVAGLTALVTGASNTIGSARS
jgi:ribose transport system ATP-binding protein